MSRRAAIDATMEDVLLTWHEMYAVGHGGLDIEHRRLLGIINRIHEAESRKDAAQQLLALSNSLYFAAMEHFRHENALMRDIIAGAYLSRLGCNNISEATVNEHCAEHASALIELENMLHAFASSAEVSLAARLRDWFVEHATRHDAQLRAFFLPD